MFMWQGMMTRLRTSFVAQMWIVFSTWSGEIKVLDQSYRVPAKIHALANNVVKRIRVRQPKTWKPRDTQGTGTGTTTTSHK